ncbi:MAG TPA: glycosyltransferase family 4 protein [Candidatus Edwardsbacteria bacterium]|nr:glycosyltransferase family 4 protein [Candidatus Edwardsbacteria bacterium]
MTVAYLNHVGIIGGAERSLLEMMEALSARGCRPLLLAPEGPLSAAARLGGIAAVPVSFDAITSAELLRFPLSLGQRWRALEREIASTIRRHEARVIHANSLKAAVLARAAAQSLRLPLIWHARDRVPIPAPVRRVLIGMVRDRAAAIIANSRYTLKAIGAVPPQGRVVLNGIPLDRYRPLARSAPVRPACVGIVGRIAPEKGQDLFVRMAADLRRRHSGLRYRIVGDVFPGAERFAQRVRRDIAAAGLAASFEWLPHCDGPEAIYGGIDILAVPSRSEGFGRVALEGMACGIPVVAADSGGVAEFSRHGEDILLFPVGDHRRGADLVARLATDADLRQRLVEGGRRTAGRLSAVKMAGQLQSVYDEVLGD